jgi:hypothetical protein
MSYNDKKYSILVQVLKMRCDERRNGGLGMDDHNEVMDIDIVMHQFNYYAVKIGDEFQFAEKELVGNNWDGYRIIRYSGIVISCVPVTMVESEGCIVSDPPLFPDLEEVDTEPNKSEVDAMWGDR